jgi:hypothetical protein
MLIYSMSNPYKPPLHTTSLFNVSDYAYQDEGLTYNYAKSRYANVNDDSDLYLTTKANGITNTAKLTDIT